MAAATNRRAQWLWQGGGCGGGDKEERGGRDKEEKGTEMARRKRAQQAVHKEEEGVALSVVRRRV